MKPGLAIGLIGAGRMGLVYARHLAHRVPGARLHAIADVRADAAEAARADCGAARAYGAFEELVADPDVEAVVVMTPTHLHRDPVLAAIAAGKPVFCEKPLALTLSDAEAMRAAVERGRGFCQVGFMRRFDAGYVAAKERIAAGAIGRPCVFKSTSKDRERPSLDYLRPENSGGIFLDLGIHDFDLARWFMGEVATVYGAAGVLAYPEMAGIGDWDNAIASLRFASGCLGSVALSRNGVYGYGIHTEIVGTEGTIQIGYDRATPILVMTQGGIVHDAVPGFAERFEDAYVRQLQDFVRNVREGRPPSVTCADALAAQAIAAAATTSARSNQVVCVGKGTATAAAGPQ